MGFSTYRIRVSSLFRRFGAGLAALVLTAGWSRAGLDYGPVSTVDDRGRAVVLLPIGSAAGAVPLVLRFAPAAAEAGWFSGGWSLPLFEARMRQVDERTFVMDDVMGFSIRFLRERRDPSRLRGSGGWRARIEGQRVEADSPEGWRMVFWQGRPEQLVTPDGQEFSYTNQGRSLIARGTRKVVADVDLRNGRVEAVQVGGTSVSFDWAKLPVFSSLGGRSVVSALVEMPEGVRVDGKLQYQIRLEPAGDGEVRFSVEPRGIPSQTYAWDAGTGRMRSVNHDRLTVDPKTGVKVWDGPFGRRVICRLPGEVPYEIDESGTRTSYYTFPQSPGAGGLRKVVAERNGVETVVYTRSIDECGRTLRERDLRSGVDEVRVYAYAGDEVRMERYVNDVLVGREVRTPERSERSLLAEGVTVSRDKDTIKILWKR